MKISLVAVVPRDSRFASVVNRSRLWEPVRCNACTVTVVRHYGELENAMADARTLPPEVTWSTETVIT